MELELAQNGEVNNVRVQFAADIERARIRHRRGRGIRKSPGSCDFQSVSSATGERERRDCIGWTLKQPILREREREPFLFS